MSLLYTIVNVGFSLYTFLVLVRCILSWLPLRRGNVLIRFIYEMTEPVLYPFRKLMGGFVPGIDFSPVLAVMVLEFARQLILRILLNLMF
ncbi:MAG: YggT family protein [Peptococcaceae bacterium]|nr:YggT family protein [Peptococcaceae bacterium]